METDACPVSITTSMAAGSSSSPSSATGSGAAPEGAPLPPFSFSATACSILSITLSSYCAAPFALTKPTTRSISSAEMKQPCTRRGLPSPSGA